MHWKGTKALVEYGERYLAPNLLKRIGLQHLFDLNQELQPNFPWADFCGKKEGQWWMVNVKTRVKREKPRTLNSSYNTTTQALENYNNAMDILKQNDFVDCKAMWLTIVKTVFINIFKFFFIFFFCVHFFNHLPLYYIFSLDFIFFVQIFFYILQYH